MTLATPASLDKWARLHPGKRRCDVYRVYGAADCAGVSDAWFTAECAAGHLIEGSACSPCRNAALIGCARCWLTGHQIVTVKVTYGELVTA